MRKPRMKRKGMEKSEEMFVPDVEVEIASEPPEEMEDDPDLATLMSRVDDLERRLAQLETGEEMDEEYDDEEAGQYLP